jgi:LemA protein
MIYVAIGIPVFIALVFILMYNSLVNRRNQAENSFSSIDVYLKKRSDLIPQLVETVRGYMKHEEQVLTKLTELRSTIRSKELNTDDRVDAENEITSGIGGIMIKVENYPDLKASGNFLQLQKSITDVEAQLAASRRAFNAAVTDYNNAVESFPSNIIAGMFNFKRRKTFTLPEESRAAYEALPNTNISPTQS